MSLIERADGRGTVRVFDRDGRELSFTLIDHGHDLTVYVDLPRSRPASDEKGER